MRKLGLLLLLVSCLSSRAATRYVGGRWFNGKTFVRDAFTVVDGKLSHRTPPKDATTVDLAGGFVVPPFADAHCHLPDSVKALAWSEPADLNAGVFYVLNPNDIAELSDPVRGHAKVDILFAHAGFTGPAGHPRRLYEDLAARGFVPLQKSELEGRAFYAIRTKADIDRVWPSYLATRPDMTKIYLLYSDTEQSEGLTPEMAKEVVRRAHRSHLRAGAHVETARDFHNALEANVDFIMHLPGYARHGFGDEAFVIPQADIVRAARAHTYVVTTTAVVQEDDALRRIQTDNLRRLEAAGVPLLIGSDRMPGTGFLDEVDHLKKSGVFSNAELLRLMTTTSRAIYPGRNIGCLRDGCEASFLVLASNPIDDLEAVKKISLRVKDGVAVHTLLEVKSRAMHAGYSGDLDALAAVAADSRTLAGDADAAPLAHYWAGYALMQRAINGVNLKADPKQINADRDAALAEMDAAIAAREPFADAHALAAWLHGWLFMADPPNGAPHRDALLAHLKRARELEPDNPRVLWEYAYVLQRSDRPRALQIFNDVAHRTEHLAPSSAEPDWGVPEAAMTLAFLDANATPPELTAAEDLANRALALRPGWYYVQQILLPQIKDKKPHP